MNPNFYNQPNKDENQKNPFLNNTPFGSQQQNSIFGNQANKPSIFGSQQPNQPQQTNFFGAQQPNTGIFGSTAPTMGFGNTTGTGAFGAQGFPNKQEGTGLFGTQPTTPATSLFGKPASSQTTGGILGNSSVFGNQNTTQAPMDPFKSQSSASPFGGTFGAPSSTQQMSSTFAPQAQPTGGLFGAQPSAPMTSTQPSNPFEAPSAQKQPSFTMPSAPQAQNTSSMSTAQPNIFGNAEPQVGSFGTQTQSFPQTQPAPAPFGDTQQPRDVFGAPTKTTETQGFPTTSTAPPLNAEAFSSEKPPLTGITSTGVSQAASSPEGQQSMLRDINSSEERPKQPTSLFSQSSGEKNISFLQMTLNEIIQQQTRKLEENIKVFKDKAKEVFDQDERIIRSLNNYKVIKNKIDEEERIIAETEDNVEFFEKWLSSFQNEVPEGSGDELLACIRELERVSDRYNRTIETLKDEEDEVMCLVNENYNLINIIDEKLDILEKY